MFDPMALNKAVQSEPGRTRRQGWRPGHPFVLARRGFVLFTLAAAMTAMMNVQVMRQPYAWKSRIPAAVIHKTIVTSHTERQGENVAKDFRQALKQDELNSANPYASLVSSEPLDRILAAGVVHYQRETLRSPAYQGESGYDMIYYRIDQQDHTHSTIFAYLEKGKSTFVIIRLGQDPSKAHYFFFRDGMLVPQSELNAQEVDAMITTRIESGIPFFTVSR